MIKTKPRKCLEKAEGCQGEYWPRNGQIYRCCFNPACIQQKYERDKEKSERKKRGQVRKEKQEFNERTRTFKGWCKYHRENAFNPFIRERDKGKPCISCGRPWNNTFQAGHFMSVGSRPELQFHPANNNGQCSGCNSNVRGNTRNVAARYRQGMVERWGEELTVYLETYHAEMNMTVDDIKEIGKHYRELKRLL